MGTERHSRAVPRQRGSSGIASREDQIAYDPRQETGPGGRRRGGRHGLHGFRRRFGELAVLPHRRRVPRPSGHFGERAVSASAARWLPKTLQISSDRRQIAFTFQTAQGRLAVLCAGPPPDNLVEGMDVVVEGRLEGPGLLQGEKLLTRCASKYKSPSADASGKPSDAAAARRP